MDFFDLHCDTPYECYMKKQPLINNSLAVSAEKGIVFGNWKQTFAIWIKDEQKEPFLLYKKILSDFKEKLKQKPDNLIPILSVEGGGLIEKDIKRIEIMKNDGIRFLTLTWNGGNKIAGGVNSIKGLSDFGEKVIKELNRLKMGCDLSHINEKSFFKAVDVAEFPIATHSNCKSVFNHKRNLSDEQIRIIAEKGGIIGLCLYPEFLGGDVFEKIYENICHIANMGFGKNIAIGTDFDGALMDEKISGIEKIPHLYEFLLKKGLKKQFLSDIFFENADKFIAKL